MAFGRIKNDRSSNIKLCIERNYGSQRDKALSSTGILCSAASFICKAK
jgi:hypothetical protein